MSDDFVVALCRKLSHTGHKIDLNLFEMIVDILGAHYYEIFLSWAYVCVRTVYVPITHLTDCMNVFCVEVALGVYLWQT